MADVPESTSTRPDAVSAITLISKLASIESTQPSASASISTIPILSTVSLSATVSTAFSVVATGSIATVTQPSLLSSSHHSLSLPSVVSTSTIASVIPATTTTQPALPFLPTVSSISFLSTLSTPSSTASVNGAIESNSNSSVNKSPITGSMSTIIFAGVGGLGVLLLVAGVIFFRRMGKSNAEKPVPIDSFNNLDHRGNQTTTPTFERNEYGEESSVELKHQQALQTRQTAKSPRTPTPVQHIAVQINKTQYPVAVPSQLVLQQQLYDPGAPATVYQEYSVAQAHFASSQGELALMLGDIVVLMHDYNNGWAYGYNKSAMVYGTFPVACVSQTQTVAAKRISTPIEANTKNQASSESSKTSEKGPSFKVGQVYTAMASFIPDRDDEIGLCIGDKIDLLRIFDDAWADGFNNSTNKDGFFPLECLNPDINLSGRSDPHRSYPQRVSSDYNQAPTLKISAKAAHDPSRASVASTAAEQHMSRSPHSASSNARTVAIGTRTMELRHSLPDSPPGKSPKHPSLYSIDSVYMSKSDHLQKENDTLERNEFSKRKSSVYSAAGVRASLYTVEERNEEPLYIVIHYFEPQLEDEIELCVRDKVRLLEEFNDGWAVVLNLETDEEGMVPLRCVERE
ncbi:hypothetical protein BJ741DRAFT_687249 [Chytriomyces cf. hyalinus JEL632]|nr:hypothetical protein BJ741DRAFT_687249 [Chytriomyces cf. hyalinus JEL632]